MATAPRTRKTSKNSENTAVSETTNENATTETVEAVAPDTAPYTDESAPNPSHDVVEGENELQVPEGASRAHGAAVKRYNEATRRLTKLDARAAKAEKEYRETQELLNSKRPGLVAEVAGAKVDVDYHQNRKATVDAALAGAQARAAGHPEDAPDNKADDSKGDEIDALPDAEGTPTNGGHVTFE